MRKITQISELFKSPEVTKRSLAPQKVDNCFVRMSLKQQLINEEKNQIEEFKKKEVFHSDLSLRIGIC